MLEGARQPRQLEPSAHLGLAGARSQRPARLSGAIAVLESAANDIGSTARLPGRVAAAPGIGIGFRARQSYPREVRAERRTAQLLCMLALT